MEESTLLIYTACVVVYVAGIFLPNRYKDILALSLIIMFMVALGLRNTNKMVDMYGSNDPMNYASLLTHDVDVTKSNYRNDIYRPDFIVFRVVGFVTSYFLNYSGAFFFLNMLYLPLIYMIYKSLSRLVNGVFYLFVGCLMFTNSGLLLLSNFFREGVCILTMVAVILYIGNENSGKLRKYVGLLAMPFLHLTSIPFSIQLFMAKKKSYKVIAATVFAAFSGLAFVLLSVLDKYSKYILSKTNALFAYRDLTTEIFTKISFVYVVMLIAVMMRRHADKERKQALYPYIYIIEGLMLPSIALMLFVQNAPQVASRYIYYFHVLAYLDLVLSAMLLRSALLRRVFMLTWPIAITCLGYFMWSYPTIARLLKW